MDEQVIKPEDIKIPLPATYGGIVLHGESSSYLIYPTYFASNSNEVKHVLIWCENPMLSRFGYPNDEGLQEHRLANNGLDKIDSLGEVINSKLIEECKSMRIISHNRIKGEQNLSQIPQFEGRHFIIPFKENLFETICTKLAIRGIFDNLETALDESKNLLAYE